MGYPVLDLRRRGLGVKGYVRKVEESLVGALAGLGLGAEIRPGIVGVWCGGGKIASLGFRVEQGVARHGFALNVCNDLTPFSWINPCGVPDCPVTSVSRELGREVGVESLARAVLPSFMGAFGFTSTRPG